MNKLYSVVLLIALFSLLLSSCSLVFNRPVLLNLPDFPVCAEGNGVAVVCWVVEYPAAMNAGIPEYDSIRCVSACASGATRMRINIVKGVNLPLLARPVFRIDAAGECIEGGFPAGAVYPADVLGGELILNWSDGFACELMRDCCRSSGTIRSFDTRSFREGIDTKAADLTDESGELIPGGCWMLDPYPVTARLGWGLYRKSALKAAEAKAFNIPVSGGSYLSDNPFYPEQTVEYNGILSVELPVNRRTVFFETASGEAVVVYFNEKMWSWVNLLSQASESGRM